MGKSARKNRARGLRHQFFNGRETKAKQYWDLKLLPVPCRLWLIIILIHTELLAWKFPHCQNNGKFGFAEEMGQGGIHLEEKRSQGYNPQGFTCRVEIYITSSSYPFFITTWSCIPDIYLVQVAAEGQFWDSCLGLPEGTFHDNYHDLGWQMWKLSPGVVTVNGNLWILRRALLTAPCSHVSMVLIGSKQLNSLYQCCSKALSAMMKMFYNYAIQNISH